MTTGTELHALNLASSGKLKLRATALLAEGTEDAIFEACVLFHEAARFERRAVEALSPCPPATRLAASIEECGCLLDGRDPHAAADVWGRVLDEAREVGEPVAAAMLVRLRPRYEQTFRQFVRVIQSAPRFAPNPTRLGLVPANATDRAAAMQELEAILAAFPGIPSLWGLLAQFEDVNDNGAREWIALRRAVRLAPENAQFRALSLITAAEVLPRPEADAYLAEIRQMLFRASAEVCLMYAFAEVLLSRRGSGREDRWRRALDAVNLAFPRTHSENLRKNLTALRFFLDDRMAGRESDEHLLYRAGLGRLAATRGSKVNVLDVLRENAEAHVSAMDTSYVAA